ncbi:MAG: response regulator transcription factor [Microthrixaceae bacterium]|jgi:DNA-binding NarL/FixJ family response regulator|nr:response regulator transcription factor [Actinomycetota bacterium]HMS14329.1 response regulator transcription factor [Microthrixaceae bacterium]HMT25293.1 response regulator transcription factor [Microthrixaceae bacterium]HMT61024.1 response regulator transcription factor [Microthrixaceae bacterium]
MLRILLADDHKILREGIRRGLEGAGETVVGEASNGEEAVELARTTQPDVVLMDLSMPVVDGIAATKRITDEMPETKVVVLTMHDDASRTRAAIAAGAVGYLTKGTSFTEVLETIRAVANGETVLSPQLAISMLRAAQEAVEHADLLSDRQVEILQKIANGYGTKQVARELGITQKTVHNHLNAIYRRLDTQSLTQAVLSAVRLGIIDLDQAES